MSDVPSQTDPTSIEPSKDDKMMAMLAHILPIVAGFIGPLIILLVKGEESPFVKFHALQSLIFTAAWTVLILVVYFLTCGLGIILILPLLPVVWAGQVYIGIQANNGKWMGYPLMDQMGRE